MGGVTVFESNVILEYLEDKYRSHEPSFKPKTPEGRQVMNPMMRVHDLYIASPNCTGPGFSHSQGAMYLSYGWHGPERGMDLKTRALKFAEIWKQLTWLNANIVGPYLVGDNITLADLTWFPTTIFWILCCLACLVGPISFAKWTAPSQRLQSGGR